MVFRLSKYHYRFKLGTQLYDWWPPTNKYLRTASGSKGRVIEVDEIIDMKRRLDAHTGGKK
jgi:hypothetical protein